MYVHIRLVKFISRIKPLYNDENLSRPKHYVRNMLINTVNITNKQIVRNTLLFA